jgi:ketosteroid isomerase-like protein
VASDNVEIVRRLYEAFRRRDNETAFRLYDRDIVWAVGDFEALDIDRVYHGHEGVRSFWRQWLSAWEELEWELVEISELEDGRVRGVIHQRNKGKGTGIWVEQRPYEQIWTLADGKVIRVDYHELD